MMRRLIRAEGQREIRIWQSEMRIWQRIGRVFTTGTSRAVGVERRIIGIGLSFASVRFPRCLEGGGGGVERISGEDGGGGRREASVLLANVKQLLVDNADVGGPFILRGQHFVEQLFEQGWERFLDEVIFDGFQ